MFIMYFVAGFFRLHWTRIWRPVVWVALWGIYKAEFYAFSHDIRWFFTGWLAPWERIRCALVLGNNWHINGLSILLTVAVLLTYRTVPMTGAVGASGAFLGEHALSIYCIHAHPTFLKSWYFVFFRAWEYKGTPRICCVSHLQFVFVTGLLSMLIDTYRGLPFACAESTWDYVVGVIARAYGRVYAWLFPEEETDEVPRSNWERIKDWFWNCRRTREDVEELDPENRMP
jgi:hypothetical protein